MGAWHPPTTTPVSRRAQDPIKLLAIRETPLSLDEVFRAVGDDAAGRDRAVRRDRAEP